MDGDSKPDLVVAIFLGNSISLFKNTSVNGTISFAAKTDIGSLNSANDVSMSDLDGDGKIDLMVCVADNVSADAISVFKNQSVAGNLSFAAKVNYSVVASEKVLAADMDLDGRQDMVVSGSGLRAVIYPSQVAVPAIDSFSPQAAGEGDTITISGTNLFGVTAVSFGGTPARSFVIQSSTTIKAVVGTGASGNITIASLQGSAVLSGFTFAAPPSISSFTPDMGGAETIVTINGANFTGATNVNFGSVTAKSYAVTSSTRITAIVESGASGAVSVTTPYGTASLGGFVFIPAPVIHSITPNAAGAGANITIRGSSFTGAKEVHFGNVPAASFTVLSDTAIVAVTEKAGSGGVKVITAGGSASFNSFTYTGPVVTSFFPAAGAINTVVFIKGIKFTGATNVSFGGVAASSFNVVSDTVLRAVVGSGATGGVLVTTPNGSASKAEFIYTSLPIITSVTPGSGLVGTNVSIKGANFGSSAENNIVYFGAVKAAVNSATTNELVVKVPFGASHQPLSVTTGGLTAATQKPFVVTYDRGSIHAGSFSGRIDLQLPSNNSSIVMMSDMDGDGKADLIALNNKNDHSVNLISLYRNVSKSGVPAFAPVFNLAIPYILPQGLSITDLDGDGKRDIVVASTASDHISLYKNASSPGSFSFASPVNLATLNEPTEVEAGDLDGDGKTDIVVSYDNYPGKFSIFRNTSQSSGSLSLAARINHTSPFDRSHGISIGDLDGDRRSDIIIANYNTAGTFTVYRNKSLPGNIDLDTAIIVRAGSNSPYAMTVDMDADGKLDVVVVNNSIPGVVSVYKNITTSEKISFAAPVNIETHSGPYRLTTGDLDGDGKPDLAIALGGTILGNIGKIQVIRNESANGLLAFASPVTYDAAYLFPSSIAIGDIDADGQMDLAVNDMLSERLTVLKNNSSNAIQNKAACAGSSLSITAGDTGNTYQWQENRGDGFVTLSNGTAYSGTNGRTLSFSNVSSSISGNLYRCLVNGIAGTTFIMNVDSVATPEISQNNAMLAVSNPDPAVIYTWSVQESGGSWTDLTTTGSSLTITKSGTYRVRGEKGQCLVTSQPKTVVFTAIYPVVASAYGIRFYPNPVTESFTIDPLNLQDNWESLEIVSADAKQTLATISLKNKKSINVSIVNFQSGSYIALLKRKTGAPAIIKFIKL